MDAQPPPPGPQPTRSRGPLLAVGGAALVVGLGLGWLLPSPLSSGGGADAAGMHEQACDLAAGAFPEGVDEDGARLGDGPGLQQLLAISSLAQAAGAADDSYADAADAGAVLGRGVTTSDLDGINTSLADLRATC